VSLVRPQLTNTETIPGFWFFARKPFSLRRKPFGAVPNFVTEFSCHRNENICVMGLMARLESKLIILKLLNLSRHGYDHMSHENFQNFPYDFHVNGIHDFFICMRMIGYVNNAILSNITVQKRCFFLVLFAQNTWWKFRLACSLHGKIIAVPGTKLRATLPVLSLKAWL
jgi:hypothetical protein